MADAAEGLSAMVRFAVERSARHRTRRLLRHRRNSDRRHTSARPHLGDDSSERRYYAHEGTRMDQMVRTESRIRSNHSRNAWHGLLRRQLSVGTSLTSTLSPPLKIHNEFLFHAQFTCVFFSRRVTYLLYTYKPKRQNKLQTNCTINSCLLGRYPCFPRFPLLHA